MSGEALRAAFLAIGSTLVAVAEFDDGLVLAGLEPLGWIPSGIAKLLLAVGAGMVMYARTGKLFGDVAISDIIAGQLSEKTASVEAHRKTDPGLGPKLK